MRDDCFDQPRELVTPDRSKDRCSGGLFADFGAFGISAGELGGVSRHVSAG